MQQDRAAKSQSRAGALHAASAGECPASAPEAQLPLASKDPSDAADNSAETQPGAEQTANAGAHSKKAQACKVARGPEAAAAVETAQRDGSASPRDAGMSPRQACSLANPKHSNTWSPIMLVQTAWPGFHLLCALSIIHLVNSFGSSSVEVDERIPDPHYHSSQ